MVRVYFVSYSQRSHTAPSRQFPLPAAQVRKRSQVLRVNRPGQFNVIKFCE
jgi:hypothetical protein